MNAYHRSRPGVFSRISFLYLTLGLIAFSSATTGAAITNAILFVTQVPQPLEVNDNTVSNVFLGVGAGFGNHLGDTRHAPRGGDLWLLKSGGTLTNLTRGQGFGVAGLQHTNGIAVRDPQVNWDGTRALFSMVIGAPASATDTNKFFWQIYEIAGLPNGPYSITKIPGQPTNYNNVSPCYVPDGRILFASDRPRDGSPHLYPQLDEYNDFPSVTGLWSLNPATGRISSAQPHAQRRLLAGRGQFWPDHLCPLGSSGAGSQRDRRPPEHRHERHVQLCG